MKFSITLEHRRAGKILLLIALAAAFMCYGCTTTRQPYSGCHVGKVAKTDSTHEKKAMAVHATGGLAA